MGLEHDYTLAQPDQHNLQNSGKTAVDRYLIKLAKRCRLPQARRAYMFFWARLVLRRHLPRIVGITGTAGKTTTTELVAAVLMHEDARPLIGRSRKTSSNMNDNIGLPLTVLGYEHLPALSKGWFRVLCRLPFRSLALTMSSVYPKTLILEYGAGGQGDIARLARLAQPMVGIVTAVGPGHLDHLKTVEGVAHEKSKLVRAVPPDGLVILPADDAYCADMARESRAKVIMVAGRGRPLSENIARAVSRHFGVPEAVIDDALRSFVAPPRRLQLRDSGSLQIIDDTYNANPLSMKLGLDTLANTAGRIRRKVAILGAMAELGDLGPRYHEEIGDYARLRADVIIGVGDLAKHYRPDRWFPDSETCASNVAADIRPGDRVLVKGSHSVRLRLVVSELERVSGVQTPARAGLHQGSE